MKKLLKKDAFEFKMNTDFVEVMLNCKRVERKDQPGTWISDEIVEAYSTLHQMGHAHCSAVYLTGEMVGGLYGLKVGKVFCGESMFSKVSNASKYCFIKYVQQLTTTGIELIDCQVHNPHLESLGARMIERKEFIQFLK